MDKGSSVQRWNRRMGRCRLDQVRTLSDGLHANAASAQGPSKDDSGFDESLINCVNEEYQVV